MEKTDNVVAACAALREAPKPDYTIADAIDDAIWVRRTPDGFMEPEKGKLLIVTLLSALERSKCYLNAVRRGQEVFVLVQQDRAAASPIELWALDAQKHGCPEAKVQEALQTARRWREQQPNVTKWPT